MAKRSLPLGKVYGLLEPGPVVLITTAHQGRTNIMSQSWHTMMEFEPPLIGCVISARNKSFEALRKTRECVIAIPTVELSDAVVLCGNRHARRREDKFQLAGLTPAPAEQVQAPLIAECYANLECTVADTSWVNKYNFFVLEVVKAWINPAIKSPVTLHHRGNGRFMLAGDTIKLRSQAK